MVIYLVVFAISVCLIYLTEIYVLKKWVHKILIFIALLIPSLLAGLRAYEIGGDTANYGVYWFNEAVKYNNWFDFIKYSKGYSIDYGYATFNYIASRFGTDTHIFLFLLCFFELLVLYLAIKSYCKKGALSLSFATYYLLYYNDSLNNLRQFPAILIVLYSYRYIKNKKLIPFLICIALASTFHVTAIFGVVLYPISWMAENKFSKLNLVLISAIVLISCFSIESIFGLFGKVGFNLVRYEHYFYNTESGGKFIRLFLFGGIWVFYLANKKRYERYSGNSSEANTFLFYSTISLAFTSLMFLGFSNFIVRLSYYFDFFLLLYLPIVTQMRGTINVKNGRVKVNANFIVIIMLLLMYWIVTYAIRNGASTIPYKFYWN